MRPLPPDEAALWTCCGSSHWAATVAGLYAGNWPHPEPLAAAAEVWWSLDTSDWLEAFDAHPRIGDRPPVGSQEHTEQSAMAAADAATRAKMAAGNAEYEERFGMTYVVRAAGRTAPQMLALLLERLENDQVDELQTAASEQWEITVRRLALLVGVPG